jgi:hypothetical protein
MSQLEEQILKAEERREVCRLIPRKANTNKFSFLAHNFIVRNHPPSNNNNNNNSNSNSNSNNKIFTTTTTTFRINNILHKYTLFHLAITLTHTQPLPPK